MTATAAGLAMAATTTMATAAGSTAAGLMTATTTA
jgi:hypothetical protein